MWKCEFIRKWLNIPTVKDNETRKLSEQGYVKVNTESTQFTGIKIIHDNVNKPSLIRVSMDLKLLLSLITSWVI